MSTDPYLIPGTGVLRDALGLTDLEELASFEFDGPIVTDARIEQWTHRPAA